MNTFMVHPEDVRRFVLQRNFTEAKHNRDQAQSYTVCQPEHGIHVQNVLRQPARHCLSIFEPDLMTIVREKGSKVLVRSGG